MGKFNKGIYQNKYSILLLYYYYKVTYIIKYYWYMGPGFV